MGVTSTWNFELLILNECRRGGGCDDVTMMMKFCEKFPLFCRLSAFIALGVTLILANQNVVKKASGVQKNNPSEFWIYLVKKIAIPSHWLDQVCEMDKEFLLIQNKAALPTLFCVWRILESLV